MDTGERMILRNERRMNACEQSIFAKRLNNAEELDLVAEEIRQLDIARFNARHAVAINVLGRDRFAKGDRSKDRELIAHVKTLDIVGGIGLGVAERLRFFQSL